MTPHAHVWTPESIARWWKWMRPHHTAAGQWFSNQCARTISKRILSAWQSHVPITRVLDFGAGQGTGLEAAFRRARASQQPLAWDRADLDQSPGHNQYDLIVVNQVIEHLDDTLGVATLCALRLRLASGGMLWVTVPYAEHLAAGMTVCPECGCTYHRMQHMRSISPSDLADDLVRAGYSDIRVWPDNLDDHAGWWARAREHPHLVATAQAGPQ